VGALGPMYGIASAPHRLSHGLWGQGLARGDYLKKKKKNYPNLVKIKVQNKKKIQNKFIKIKNKS
jgi:hypothetical protein